MDRMRLTFRKIEKRKSLKNNDFRPVNPMGFKPMTFRTGI